jgi:undecaprenyl-diphosphatase
MIKELFWGLVRLDEKLLFLLSIKIKNVFFDRVMPYITRSNDCGQIYFILAFIALFWNGNRVEFANILLALTLGLVFGEGLIKYVFKRQRPAIEIKNYDFLINMPNSFSFPSGHTTSSFAVLGVAWYMNLSCKYLILILAILIAFSRIYLRVHYPTDIIGGIVLGFICAGATISITAHLDFIRFLYLNVYIASHSLQVM